ncbi:hypothetical protein FA13DRAFT_943307 [Coprinellus micaceus]|uniref:Uncharacterized protein n=1 Tax=Coprinellus micaceus TaxID=71717 RepID=A0A4Y7RZ00_COPMI|nr:hypothetical protein FA13DRAFT_943307 [Coprinellus micaceus]
MVARGEGLLFSPSKLGVCHKPARSQIELWFVLGFCFLWPFSKRPLVPRGGQRGNRVALRRCLRIEAFTFTSRRTLQVTRVLEALRAQAAVSELLGLLRASSLS